MRTFHRHRLRRYIVEVRYPSLTDSLQYLASYSNEIKIKENWYFLSKTSRLQRARSSPSDIRSRQKTYLDIAGDEICRLRYVLNEKMKCKVPIWADEKLDFPKKSIFFENVGFSEKKCQKISTENFSSLEKIFFGKLFL